ncbi:MAG: alpha/beta hydrolase, partial [bacterium]|nr:alpha/beta hydrolase [bacterium]
GVYYAPSEYDPEPTPFTWRLIEEGRDNLLLNAPIEFEGPVRLIHGMADPDVPWQHSLTIAEALSSNDVEITFIKGGDHRLSEDHDLTRMVATVESVCAGLENQ